MGKITFIPEELKDKLIEVVNYCLEYEIEVMLDEIDLASIDLLTEQSIEEFLSQEDYEEDVIVDEDAVLKVGLPRTDQYNYSSIDELYKMIQFAIQGKIEENIRFITPNLALFHVNCDYILMQDEKEKEKFSISQLWEGKQICVSVAQGLTSYALKLVMDGTYDKYYPPIEPFDLFIKIEAKQELSSMIFDDIVESYIFELQNSYSIDMGLLTRLTSVTHDYIDPRNNSRVGDEIRIRPLLNGKGIKPLLKIYNSCNQIEDDEFRILNYTKVIEFVSQTVIRKEMLDSILKKLYSPRVLQPDATYILELEQLYDEHRSNKRDNQAISLTVGTCCDTTELIEIAPKYLKKFSEFKKSPTNKDLRSQCLDELASAISDTRNMIAHAKTNYRRKGKECPNDQLEEFANCLKIVASQVINWFARQHEDGRIV